MLCSVRVGVCVLQVRKDYAARHLARHRHAIYVLEKATVRDVITVLNEHDIHRVYVCNSHAGEKAHRRHLSARRAARMHRSVSHRQGCTRWATRTGRDWAAGKAAGGQWRGRLRMWILSATARCV